MNVPHERRGHSRMRVKHLQVGYRPGGWLKALISPAFPGKALVLDVSGAGMRLLVSRVQQVTDALSFQLQGARMNEHIRVAGRVTRCLKAGHLYELGVRLTRAGEDYRGLIGRFRQDPLLSQGF